MERHTFILQACLEVMDKGLHVLGRLATDPRSNELAGFLELAKLLPGGTPWLLLNAFTRRCGPAQRSRSAPAGLLFKLNLEEGGRRHPSLVHHQLAGSVELLETATDICLRICGIPLAMLNPLSELPAGSRFLLPCCSSTPIGVPAASPCTHEHHAGACMVGSWLTFFN